MRTDALAAEAGSPAPRDRAAIDQQLLRDLIQEGLQCSTADGGTTQERREHEVVRFCTLIKVLVRACLLDIPAKLAADGFEAVATQARNTLAIIRRNVKLRHEILALESRDADDAGKAYPAVALFKWLIPRLLHAASQLEHTADERALRADILACVVDVVKGLMADASPENMHVAYSNIFTAIYCLSETCQDLLEREAKGNQLVFFAKRDSALPRAELERLPPFDASPYFAVPVPGTAARLSFIQCCITTLLGALLHQRLTIPAWNIPFADVLIKAVLQLDRFAQIRRREGNNLLKNEGEEPNERPWWNQADVAELCGRVVDAHVISSVSLESKIGCILAETTKWTMRVVQSVGEAAQADARVNLVQRLDAVLEKWHASSGAKAAGPGRSIFMDIVAATASAEGDAQQIPEYARGLLATAANIAGGTSRVINLWQTLDQEKLQSLRTVIGALADKDQLKKRLQPVIADLDDSVLDQTNGMRPKGIKRKRTYREEDAPPNNAGVNGHVVARNVPPAFEGDQPSWEDTRWRPILQCMEAHWHCADAAYTQQAWLPLHDLTPREMAAMETDEAGMRQTLRLWSLGRASEQKVNGKLPGNLDFSALLAPLIKLLAAGQAQRIIDSDWIEIWLNATVSGPASGHPLSAQHLEGLRVMLDHIKGNVQAIDLRRNPALRGHLKAGIGHSQRQIRLATARTATSLYRALLFSHDPDTACQAISPLLTDLKSMIKAKDRASEEVIIALHGQFARLSGGEMLGDCLQCLMKALGSSSQPLRSLAYVELLGVVKEHGQAPYVLVKPYFERISVLLVNEGLDNLNEAVQFLGVAAASFLTSTESFTLPALVMKRRRSGLDLISRTTGRHLGVILLEHLHEILAKLFLQDDQVSYQQGAAFLVDLFNEIATDSSGLDRPVGPSGKGFTLSSLLTSCIVNFLVEVVVHWGDLDQRQVRKADRALERAQSALGMTAAYGKSDLGAFLKNHMLGIISCMNDILLNLQGMKSVQDKCRVIRSLGQLVERVGGGVSAAFCPQIMASLQSSSTVPDLRLESLRAWEIFMKSLSFADLGPYIGPSTAAFVSIWPELNKTEKDVACNIVRYLVIENASELRPYTNNIVDMEGIPELQFASTRLSAERRAWPFSVALEKLMERCQHNNVTVAARSLGELKRFMLERRTELAKLAQGDAFDASVGGIYRTLLGAAGRDGENCDEVRLAAYECIGVLGALDPDRVVISSPKANMILRSNFADQDESIDFVLHIIEQILVDAFRTTHDTKHQAYLAFTIQELLKFCKFSPKLLQPGGAGSIPLKVRQRWAALPKHLLETLTPLLEGRFSWGETANRTYDHPIYPASPTYREWLQKWTADLISRVMLAETTDDPLQAKHKHATENAKAIFGAFRPVLRNQDVGVVHHLLPHLVLYVLVSGSSDERLQIIAEIHAVLQDQVNPSGLTTADKRSLSAQAIFDLLDHLSRWLQDQKNALRDSRRKDRSNSRVDAGYMQLEMSIAAIDNVLGSIDGELMAHAALQSRAYARSLRNFEQRIAHLKHADKRSEVHLQTYYEHLHRIYADLDEPDGMEGVSTSVISPSLEHQIREHESVGRWTSAQSCWEVKLQQSPDDVQLHIGLMRCLRNLGHFDTLRTHIRGLLTRWPDWAPQLASFKVEAAWTLGDWTEMEEALQHSVGGGNVALAGVLLAMQKHSSESVLQRAIQDARQELGAAVSADHRQYARAYESVLGLHMLHELELIRSSGSSMSGRGGVNQVALVNKDMAVLRETLRDRLSTTMPSYRIRESLLGLRRTAFALSPANQAQLKAEIGLTWIASSKIARKAGHEQTAYSALLQAKEAKAPFAFVQQAKLLRAMGEPLKALTDVLNNLQPLISGVAQGVPIMAVEGDVLATKQNHRSLSKAVSLVARWAYEADRLSPNDIIGRYKQAIDLAPDNEGPYYQLGHYYDLAAGTSPSPESLHALTCENYALALRYGTKYIYQTMPRMLTLWLDIGEQARKDKSAGAGQSAAHATPAMVAIEFINKHIDKARRVLPVYQWLTAFPQIVSRIGHPSTAIKEMLQRTMIAVLQQYPRQAIWSMVGVSHSKGGESERAKRCDSVFRKVQASSGGIPAIVIREAISFSSMLLKLSTDPGIDPAYENRQHGKDYKPNQNNFRLSIKINFPYAAQNPPTQLILPLQDALTCALPSSAETVNSHEPFPKAPVTIKSLIDQVDVMPSLQRPKKIGFMGDDKRRYFFLCKPHDDLRKDARLMDFNSMINKLLKGGSESRKRNLHIRTYAVMPLNEECGLLEWVNNTVAFRSILEKAYGRHNKKLYSTDIYNAIEGARGKLPHEIGRMFRNEVLAQYSPPVFHEWFFQTWPEPTAWFAARSAYARTLAVMSMVGFVLGLGDRHGENILFDSVTGDTVHVDFNCLFEKGKTFEIPERVPFRLTHNLVDGLGATGVEGAYRKAAEIALETLRVNKDSLMSVLEAFIHDPLVEWEEQKRREERYRARSKVSAPVNTDLRSLADRSLLPIGQKLQGHMSGDKSEQKSVVNQVDALIKEATNPSLLGAMYSGWASWL